MSQSRRTPCETEREIGAMCPQVKDCWQPQKSARHKEVFPPRAFGESTAMLVA